MNYISRTASALLLNLGLFTATGLAAETGNFPFTVVTYGEMDVNYPFVDNNQYQKYGTGVTVHFVPDDTSIDYSTWTFTLGGTNPTMYVGAMKEQNGRTPLMVNFSTLTGKQEFCLIDTQQSKYCTFLNDLESDTEKPGTTITGPDGHDGSDFTVSIKFSENVAKFEVGDVAVTNGTKGNFTGAGSSYELVITPDAGKTVTVSVAADVAEDPAKNGNTAAAAISIAPDTTPPTVSITGPTDAVTEDFTATFTFSEDVTGFTADDVVVTNGTKGAFAGSGKVYTLVVTPELGKTVTVAVAANVAEDGAGNGNEAAETFEVLAGSVATEFEANKVNITNILISEARRSTVSMVSSNRLLAQEARGRFIDNLRKADDGFVGANNVAFGMEADGRVASGGVVSTQGKFFQQTGNDEGTYRRLFFGDFDVQHDKDTGSKTATLSGKLAWEHMTSENTMVGYFIGLDLGRSDIDGAFIGDQKSAGMQVGTYAVTELDKNLYLDGFLTVGAGKNQLEMNNGTLALESDYISKTASFGAAVTGVFEQEGYEIWPELALTVGHTKLGTVDFTGRAFGLVDNNLSLDAGDVTIASLMFRPEVRMAADGRDMQDSRTLVTFAPRAMCESVKTTVTNKDCGFGSEFGFTARSESGLTNLNAKVVFDKIGSSVRRGLQLNIEHRF